MLPLVKYIDLYWAVYGSEAGCVLALVDPAPPEGMKGRTLLVRDDGVWECSRDGKLTPIAQIDNSGALLERITWE